MSVADASSADLGPRATTTADRYGAPIGAATLAVAMLAALVGGPAARLGVGLAVAVLAWGLAWLVRTIWRRRAASGTAVLLLLVPLAALALIPLTADRPAVERAARAVDVTVATMLVAAAVLVFAGVRRLALTRRRTGGSPWATFASTERLLAGDRPPAIRMTTAGVMLVATSMLLIVLAPRGFAGSGTSWGGALLLLALATSAVIAAPALAAMAVVNRRDRAERERALQRQAVAAHLHDSVLQTFALVQRRLDDPDEVRRLIRRQERELRDWLAGRDPRRPDMLGGALQQVIDDVETELHVSIELELLGDRRVDRDVGSLVDATREALRNAARHGDGAPIRVLAAADGPTTEVYVRDEGPGFVPDEAPIERRGIRDAIIGRMTAVGGSAVIDAAPGAGTEVVLRLPSRSDGAS